MWCKHASALRYRGAPYLIFAPIRAQNIQSAGRRGADRHHQPVVSLFGKPYFYNNLNLTLKPGQLTVITGPSGCGRSTLAKLLQGFYPAEDCRIDIDGRDIRHLSTNELRQYYGVVPQETVLFANTVYENLSMASPHAAFDDVITASKMAEIHEVIEKMPQGYQTHIGEHGVGLSGGQKQRIAIARALLKRPQILIFDEATSGLDQLTAEQFTQTINQLQGKVTMAVA